MTCSSNPISRALCAAPPRSISAKFAFIPGLAKEAKFRDPEKFAQAWHMLMKGSIVSAVKVTRMPRATPNAPPD